MHKNMLKISGTPKSKIRLNPEHGHAHWVFGFKPQNEFVPAIKT